jgi:predicted regulator of Ras-like GTPase activity (Roadblock/LC7/MglB family)
MESSVTMPDGGPPQSTVPESTGWLLDDFAANTPGVRQAILVSSDGLLMHHAGVVDTDPAERLSAVTSNLISAGHAAGREIDERRCQQMMLRYAGGHLLIMGVLDLASIVAVTDKGAKLDVISQAMIRLVEGTGRVLAPKLRTDSGAPPTGPGDRR